MEKLTERQKQVLDFIAEFISRFGTTPTIREIASGFRISIGPAQKHVKTLVRKGYLKHRPGMARGIELAQRRPWASVPLLGSVQAGLPREPFENAEGYVCLDSGIVKGGKYFALKVRGDSMTGSGIFENDLVVVKQQPAAEDGDIVVALAEGEAAVKILRKKKDGIHLESSNPKYRPIHSDEITVLGRVVHLMRDYKRN